jgi:hypothetical protein
MSPKAIAGSCLRDSIIYEQRPSFTSFHYCRRSRCRKTRGEACAADPDVAQTLSNSGSAELPQVD